MEEEALRASHAHQELNETSQMPCTFRQLWRGARGEIQSRGLEIGGMREVVIRIIDIKLESRAVACYGRVVFLLRSSVVCPLKVCFVVAGRVL